MPAGTRGPADAHICTQARIVEQAQAGNLLKTRSIQTSSLPSLLAESQGVCTLDDWAAARVAGRDSRNDVAALAKQRHCHVVQQGPVGRACTRARVSRRGGRCRVGGSGAGEGGDESCPSPPRYSRLPQTSDDEEEPPMSGIWTHMRRRTSHAPRRRMVQRR